MNKEKKSSRIKSLISGIFGIKEWKLNGENHLDISKEELDKISAEYGAEFVTKFEKLLSDENGSQVDTNTPKSDMNLQLLCALLGIGAIAMSEDGKTATLNKEQLEKIEGGLKDLTDQKTAAETNLASAKTEKGTAESALSTAIAAMDELDPTVKAVKEPKEKVDVIRTLLAAKPGKTATLTKGTEEAIEMGKDSDPVNAYVKEFFNYKN
jgi:hypothetical protein